MINRRSAATPRSRSSSSVTLPAIIAALVLLLSVTDATKVVNTLYSGGLNCETTGTVRRVEYKEGTGCNQIMGERMTTAYYYTMVCGTTTTTSTTIGSPTGNATSADANAGKITVTYFTDAACTQFASSPQLVVQNKCVQLNSYESMRWTCEAGDVQGCLACAANRVWAFSPLVLVLLTLLAVALVNRL